VPITIPDHVDVTGQLQQGGQYRLLLSSVLGHTPSKTEAWIFGDNGTLAFITPNNAEPYLQLGKKGGAMRPHAIDPAKIGLIGHSEGAMIAPAIASDTRDLPWIVLLAPPATKGEDTLLNQSDLIARAGGMPDAQILSSLNFDKEAYDLVQKEQDSAVITKKLKDLVKSSSMDTAMPPGALDAQLRMMTSPWFRYFLSYDPVPDLKKTKCPVLVLYGEKDLQVPPKINLPLVQKAFKDGGNTQAEVRQLPDLNHLFQHAYKGSPSEYAAIDETFSPDALKAVGDWLQARSKQK